MGVAFANYHPNLIVARRQFGARRITDARGERPPIILFGKIGTNCLTDASARIAQLIQDKPDDIERSSIFSFRRLLKVQLPRIYEGIDIKHGLIVRGEFVQQLGRHV